jgi:hypothetical protein
MQPVFLCEVTVRDASVESGTSLGVVEITTSFDGVSLGAAATGRTLMLPSQDLCRAVLHGPCDKSVGELVLHVVEPGSRSLCVVVFSFSDPSDALVVAIDAVIAAGVEHASSPVSSQTSATTEIGTVAETNATPSHMLGIGCLGVTFRELGCSEPVSTAQLSEEQPTSNGPFGMIISELGCSLGELLNADDRDDRRAARGILLHEHVIGGKPGTPPENYERRMGEALNIFDPNYQNPGKKEKRADARRRSCFGNRRLEMLRQNDRRTIGGVINC